MTVRGTRNLVGDSAKAVLDAITTLRVLVEGIGFTPFIPSSLAYKSLFAGQVGDNRMYEFQDRSQRELVLVPEITAVAREEHRENPTFPSRIWYASRCYRYDRPQRGRHREFWQFGVEIFKPAKAFPEMIAVACLLALGVTNFTTNYEAERGQSYYKGRGFEIWKDGLQLVGGGPYAEGVGFALGVERCLLVREPQ